MRGTPVPNKFIEDRVADQYKPSEVITYKLSPEELKEKYGEPNKSPLRKTFTWGSIKGGKKVRINEELVRKEIENGLTKAEIVKKYNADKRIVGRLVSKIMKEEQEQQDDEQPNDTYKEPDNKPKLKIKSIEVEGNLFNYRIQGENISMIRENLSLKISKYEIEQLKGELDALKEVIVNG